MENQRLFTLEEALELLPLVRQLLIELQQRKARWEECNRNLQALKERVGGNGHLQDSISMAQRALEAAAEAVELRLGELVATGAELKGLDEGLIDFPSEREGRVVYLCWRLGEDTITYWHELDTGFAGRRPL